MEYEGSKLPATSSKSIIATHASFNRSNKNYVVVNELESGSYFGEISLLTNLPATASVHTVSNTVCGRMSREALLNFFDVFTESRKQVAEKLFRYNDPFFASLVKAVRNVGCLRALDSRSAKRLIFRMRKRRVARGQVLVRFKEAAGKAFFVFAGAVCVYVVDPTSGTRHPFQVLMEGSAFNFVNCVMGYYSLFEIEADTD